MVAPSIPRWNLRVVALYTTLTYLIDYIMSSLLLYVHILCISFAFALAAPIPPERELSLSVSDYEPQDALYVRSDNN